MKLVVKLPDCFVGHQLYILRQRLQFDFRIDLMLPVSVE